jgi:methionyl-tRNA formyltransferase
MFILNDVAMIAADTSRSRAYIQALLSAEIAPSRVFILDDADRPGQAYSDNVNEMYSVLWGDYFPYKSLQVSLTEKGILWQKLTSPDINGSETIKIVSSSIEPVFIYSGFGGVILRSDILNTGKNFLHIHGGYLPRYKGSTTNYYSFLNEQICGASAIFMRKKLDSGPLLMRRFWYVDNIKDIDYIFDGVLRAQVLLDTIKYKITHNSWPFENIDGNEHGEMYYIIHPLLRHIALYGKSFMAESEK